VDTVTTEVLTRPTTPTGRRSGARGRVGGRAASSGTSRREGPSPTASEPAVGSSRFGWTRRAKDSDLVALCQHLSALYGSGIALAEGLRTFAAETGSKALQRVIFDVVADVETGRSLSESFERHPEQFSAYFRASIRAGETSGTMGATLDRLARQLEKRQEMAQSVKNAFAYPVVLTVLIVSVVTFLVTYIVPVFADVYARMNVTLPLPTRMLLAISGFLSANPWLPVVPVGLVLGAVAYVRKKPSARVAVDRWKIRLPLVGRLWQRMVLYRFVRTFGEMMAAGVPVLECLNLAGKVSGNVAFDQALETVRADVERGMGLTEPIRRTGWFPASLVQVIASGEQSGRVAALLERAGDMLEREIDLVMKRCVSRLEPLLTVGMAAAVGFILLAVYLPMFDVMQHVGK
jgi:type II secretory pathway component PulF